MMKVEYFTTTDFAVLSPSSTIRDALQIFLEKRVDLACVTESGKLTGIVTKYSIYRLLLKNAALDQSVRDGIKTQIIAIKKDMSLYAAKDIMMDGKVSHAVVLTDKGDIFGIMSKSDLIRGIMSEVQNLAERLSALLENLQDAVISVDESLMITTFNLAAKTLFQFDDKTTGSDIEHILPSFTKELKDSLTTGEIIEAKRIVVSNITVIASFIPIRQMNSITGAMVVLRDVTAYESIANELDTTNKLKRILDSALEFAYDGVIITDQEGSITMANEGFLDLFQFNNATEVIGQSIFTIAPELPANKSLEYQEVIKGELVTIQEKSCIITQTPILRDGLLIGAIFKIMFRQLEVWKDLLVRMEHLENELTYYRGELIRVANKDSPFSHVITNNPQMNKLLNDAFLAGQSFSTILISGESGTGKELIAEGIHNSSGRHGSFIKVNCAAIPADLIESEFFGYADGAFTGAKRGGKPGKFELADQGTLFLDEIGDMPLALQAKLLRVLQEKEFERVGDTKTTHVDVRIIAASNKDLWQLVQENQFREDLYYRINVIQLQIPPLRNRLDDIPLLCDHLIEKINKKMKKNVLGISPSAVHLLQSQQWPGNVRQLENVIERAFHFCQGYYINLEHLSDELFHSGTGQRIKPGQPVKDKGVSSWLQQINDAEKKAILEALQKVDGNKTKAAKILGISRSTLYQKMNQYKIKTYLDYASPPF
ncbi:hypothetical protein CVD28_05955 [Bacillus sp. M6-12]|uniref:sigma-54-dependent Fis family transcriptional regulator n=1 Tax=Bacillus sp. M6-12 TaxID=2054166 RepID=UPI000C783C38|nr:sigma-54-dependent Fis family transcriptional regulator [Bacillus sp. M6-12]PLS18669.1 hypothetical protein CVD28_05955 [Bacillus sp. M6-12]